MAELGFGSDWRQAISDRLADLRRESRHRRRRVVESHGAAEVFVDGRRRINFSSNDYLDLANHPRLIAAAQSAAARFGVGSGAAGLICGHGPAHTEAEQALAKWKNTETAVLLPSGYQANHAAVQALAAIGGDPTGVRFLIDKLAHASLIDAVRATGSPFRVFPHNHLGKMERLLADREPKQLQVVVTESIFSMDGDAADLAGLADLKRRHDFFLLLDEAHGSGVYGPAGAGLAAELGLQSFVDATVVTCSKALGCAGGAVCASAEFCDAVVNLGRAYIYSTAVSPMIAAATTEAIAVMRDEPERQARVRASALKVRRALADAGHAIPPGDSPIIPLILGIEDAALAAAAALQERGMLVVAVRPPTVPRGQSRLRVTLSAAHTDEQIDQLIHSIIHLISPSPAGRGLG